MLAWVTGATGFVGSALVGRLLGQGDEVVALVRPESVARAPRGVRVAQGVLPDVAGLEGLPLPDVVFHCAAVIDAQVAESRAVHVDGTVRLAELARGARFVHLSTTDVLPRSSPTPLSESAPCAPDGPYAATKLEGERRLLALRPDAVVLRPPGIYGPRSTRDVIVHTARRILRGTFFYVGDGTARRSWIFVDTLVDMMLHAAARPDVRGTFLVDDGRSASRRELAESVAMALGRRARFPHVPIPVARGAAWAFERALPRLGLSPPLTTAGVDYSITSQPLDTSRWKATGFTPGCTPVSAIDRTLAWARAAGRL